MTKWRLAESLKKLREQINEAYPNRSKISDGSIGDEAHRKAGASDHNPNDAGVVCAIDVTHDPRTGCTGDKLAAALIKSRDPRIKYIIWNRRILSSYGSQSWRWRPYSGKNAHAHHLHLSVAEDKKLYDSKAVWKVDFDIAVVRPAADLRAAGASDAIQQSEEVAVATPLASQPSDETLPAQPLPDPANLQPAQTNEAGSAGVIIQPNALDSKPPVSAPDDDPIKIIKGKAGNLLNYFSGAGILGGAFAFVKDNPWLIVFFFTLVFLGVITIVLINHHKKVIEARTASDPDLYKIKFVKDGGK
jgi:hypothetical protein